MRIVIAVAATLKDAAIEASVADYLRRASFVYRSDLMQVRSDAVRRGQDVARARAAEGERLLKATADTWTRIALDERGDLLTSQEFASVIERAAIGAAPGIAFLIGAPHGLDPALVGACSRSVALSRMTLNHQHAVLVLAEQLYRATTLITGAPYHK
ncbi:MAG: hypothetical protein AMXMBFR64_58510 [Myxococcales bacterium]